MMEGNSTAGRYRCIVCEGPCRVFKYDARYAVCDSCGLVMRMASENGNGASGKIICRPEEEEARIEKDRKGIFSKILRRLSLEKPGKGSLLDVGCGAGTFIGMAKCDGWDAAGVEVAECYAKHTASKGLDVRNCSLSAAGFSDEIFDVVTFINVLDFIEDPCEALKETKRVLKHSGVLYLRLPNAAIQVLLRKISAVLMSAGIKCRSMGEFSNFGFTDKNIAFLLKKTGFRDIRVEISPVAYRDVYKYGLPFIPFIKRSYQLLSFLVFLVTARKGFIPSSMTVIAKK